MGLLIQRSLQSEPPTPKVDLAELRRNWGLAAAAKERKKQAGSWGWWEGPFFPPVLANPNPCFQAALQSPWLLRHSAESACSGRMERLPASGGDWGDGVRQRVCRWNGGSLIQHSPGGKHLPVHL